MTQLKSDCNRLCASTGQAGNICVYCLTAQAAYCEIRKHAAHKTPTYNHVRDQKIFLPTLIHKYSSDAHYETRVVTIYRHDSLSGFEHAQLSSGV